jgi:hypothetical protein
VFATQSTDNTEIVVAQMKISFQLFMAGLLDIVAESFTLFLRQKNARHRL